MNPGRRITGYLILLASILALTAGSCGDRYESGGISAKTLPDSIDFNFHVRPILSDRCYKCHGPDEKTREAGLRLDLEAAAFLPLDSASNRFAIVPGNTEQSVLINRIFHQDPDEMMPPPESNLNLSDQEKEILVKWIEQGAKWKSHWAFIPPKQKEIPPVKDADWPQNEIDFFTQRQMELQGLTPGKEASKEKLIRRLSFDLRGIPPSLEEIDSFLQDQGPNAYENLVDRFLNQPAYGERMAMEWLDLARYADSHGYQDDLERSMWPWRNWVIKAFNQNMPYDTFVSWQLAGDLLPNPSYEQKLATAFNRNHKITQEVGVVDEEYRVEYVLDRVNTLSTSFLGMTVACAQCHDHKFDPISQKEYYQLFSFFNQVPEQGRVEYGVEVADPTLPLPEETVSKYKAFIQEKISEQQKSLSSYQKEHWSAFKSPTDTISKASGKAFARALKAYYPLDYMEDSLIYEEVRGTYDARLVHSPVPIPGKKSGGLEFNSMNYLDIGPAKNWDFRKAYTISMWLYSIDGGISGQLLAAGMDKEGINLSSGINIRGDKTFTMSMKGRGKGSIMRVASREEIPPDQWVHFVLSYDGSRKAKGVKMYLNGKELEVIAERDLLRNDVATHQNLRIAGRLYKTQSGLVPGGIVAGRMDEVMFFQQELDLASIQELGNYQPIDPLKESRFSNENIRKRQFFEQLHHQDAQFQTLTERLREYKIRQMRLEKVVLKPTMIMADMDTARPTFILERGLYSAPSKEVFPGTPHSILPFDESLPKNRLGLAQWLFDPNHPLTARVAVNRYWQMIFGRGLVATPEDFGSQGDLPSHPDLLDWLAIDFQDNGWNVKRLLKHMLMSATYRQEVRLDPQNSRLDPDNIFLARGPQGRLSAELIRDQALAISGLLSSEIGGPSVKPYHPEGLWLETASGNQPLRKYIQDHEQDLYRKSMYTFWKRTIPPPSMITFDAPSREQCVVRRQTTSTPMQALVLLNDPQMIEAGRQVAVRMLEEGRENPQERIQFAFRLATSRSPSKKEVALLLDLLKKEHQNFENAPEEAKAIISIGEYPVDPSLDPVELAAYTQVALAIMNLTETIMKA